MTKHRGGRGRRSENKHQTVTISLPPELKAALDAATTPTLSRSEVVARLIQNMLDTQATQKKVRAFSKAILDNSKAKEASKPKQNQKAGRRGNTERLALSAPVLHVMQRTIERRVRGQLRWEAGDYDKTQQLLAEGDVLQAEGLNYVTEKGSVMSWRRAEALVRQGVLVVPPR